jgi:hypothetical protein
MALTVIQAFNKFMTDCVNLDPDDSSTAKSSRDWLMGQIEAFPNSDNKFPEIYIEKNFFLGSFSRRTKKRPLDDIDIMICLKADGCTYNEFLDKIEINTPDTALRFKDYINEGTNVVNSRKVINAFVTKLSGVPQYKKAEIKRNLEAATLNLSTYDWTFDIVPCFFTTEDANKRTYYIIPDGKGNWKKTDPRLDLQRVSTVNDYHEKNVLNVIRAIKYWNSRPTMPTIGSYLLENMVLDYYSEQTIVASKFVDIELVKVFLEIHRRIYNVVNDPKNIQGNLNTLTYDEKKKIADKAYIDYSKAYDARQLEVAKNQTDSIKLWIEIFGEQFPKNE